MRVDLLNAVAAALDVTESLLQLIPCEGSRREARYNVLGENIQLLSSASLDSTSRQLCVNVTVLKARRTSVEKSVNACLEKQALDQNEKTMIDHISMVLTRLEVLLEKLATYNRVQLYMKGRKLKKFMDGIQEELTHAYKIFTPSSSKASARTALQRNRTFKGLQNLEKQMSQIHVQGPLDTQDSALDTQDSAFDTQDSINNVTQEDLCGMLDSFSLQESFIVSNSFKGLPPRSLSTEDGRDTVLSKQVLSGLIGEMNMPSISPQAAYELFEQAHRRYGPRLSDEDLAEVLHVLGLSLAEAQDYERAEVCHRQALRMRTEQCEENDPAIASSLAALGIVLLEQVDRKEEALDCVLQAVDIERSYADSTGSPSPRFQKCLIQAAFLLNELGRVDEALALQLELLDVQIKLRGYYHPDVAAAMMDIGVKMMQAAAWTDARRMLDHALRCWRNIYASANVKVAVNLFLLGEVCFQQQDFGAAEAYFQGSLSIRRELTETDHAAEAEVHQALGLLYQAQGSMTDACKNLSKAIATFKVAFGEFHESVVMAHLDLAVALRESNMLQEAHATLEQALHLAASVFSGDAHHPTVQMIQEVMASVESDMMYSTASHYHFSGFHEGMVV